MDTKSRIESALEKAVARASGSKAPPRIAEALRHAVFPGGARIRPRLCHAVAAACGDDAPPVTDGAAAALKAHHAIARSSSHNVRSTCKMPRGIKPS